MAGVGVVAMKKDAFRDLPLCNKMYDYIAMRKPVVMSRTNAVLSYYGDDSFQYFAADDEHDLARAIRELYDQPSLRQDLAKRARTVNEPYRWPCQRAVYLRIIDALSRGKRGTQVQLGRDSSAPR
jgi:glycosyltransferase involved in cell wall biosynthesis